MNVMSTKEALQETPLLESLNEQQRDAVTHTDGPLLIIAGAGTGKTTVLTKRVAWLIQEQDVPSESILALTFTEKAAEEMEQRVDQLLPMGYTDLAIDTFHGFCDKILKEFGLEIGLDTNYTLLTQADQWLFLRNFLFELPLRTYRPLGRPNAFLAELAKHFSRAKDEDISPRQYIEWAESAVNAAEEDEDREEAKAFLELANTYEAYQQLMTREGYMDFGDLIMYTLKLIRERPAVRKKLQQRFQYVLVDEFQDTNIAQMELVKLLAAPHNNITVVGDDAQAIYKFRGASVSNILQYRETYKDAKQVVLTQNYRSTQPILDLAYASIQFNNPDTLEFKEGIDKKLTSAIGGGESPRHFHEKTVEREALAVVNTIIDLKNEDPSASWEDNAILVRSNSHAEIFATYLAAKGIPFTFRAAKGLYSKPTIMDLLAYLRVLADPHDSVSMYRVLSMPVLAFPHTDLTLLSASAQRSSDPLFRKLLEHNTVAGVSEEGREIVDIFVEMLQRHAKRSREEEVGTIVLSFLEDTGLLKDLKADDSAENVAILQEITLFFKRLQEFAETGNTATVKQFIDELDLLIEAGEDPSPVMQGDTPDAVQLMTVHGSKGLEFRNVFVANLVSDRFPTRKRREALPLPDALVKEQLPEQDPHLLEERRLFYVAMTRAKERLYLSSAVDYGGKRKKKLSRFLLEIRPKLQELQPKDPEQVGLFEDVAAKIAGPAAPVVVQKKHELPSKLSFSQIKAFETCPRQYEFSHIHRIPGKGSHVFSYGKSIHAALQHFYQGLLDGREPKREELVELLDMHWVNEYYQSALHSKERKKEAKEALNKYFDRYENVMKAPYAVEKGFNLKVGQYTFKGFIDRMDQEDDGTITIIDYKSGSPPKKQKDVDENVQLSLYALAVQEVFEMTPGRLVLEYVDAGERWETQRSQEELNQLKDELLETVAEMQDSDFLPTPGFHCQFCDFKNICDAAQR